MVRLIVKAPLANDKIGTTVFDLLDHTLERCTLILLEAAVLLNGADIELVLRLGARRLQRACKDRDACIADLTRHLRMREVFINHDTLHQHGVVQTATHLTIDLDQIKVHVSALQISDR